MALTLLLGWWGWLFGNPTDVTHGSYNFWSGIGSDFGEITLVAAVIGLYYHHMCHVPRCYRLAWHPHPDTGHPVCQHHHPHDPRQDVLTKREA